MRHAKVTQFHTIVGWSLGAQVALTCVSKYPHVTDQLFLLNPSSGETVGCSFQTVFPLPKMFRTLISQGNTYSIVNQLVVFFSIVVLYANYHYHYHPHHFFPFFSSSHAAIFGAIDVLLPLIPTSIWVGLKTFFLSSAFRVILEFVAFFGGFPPEQPPYFQEYMRDVFNSHNQTRGLLLLIKALDEPLPDAAMTLPHKTQIISGLPDTMTGVFNAFRLHSSMPNSKVIMEMKKNEKKKQMSSIINVLLSCYQSNVVVQSIKSPSNPSFIPSLLLSLLSLLFLPYLLYDRSM